MSRCHAQAAMSMYTKCGFAAFEDSEHLGQQALAGAAQLGELLLTDVHSLWSLTRIAPA